MTSHLKTSTLADVAGGDAFDAIYARYSTHLQRETSIEDQVRINRNAIARAGGDPDKAIVFADRAMSGAGLDRPDFERLMALVNAGKVRRIWTEELSRISRDFADSAMIFRELQFRRVPLIGVSDGIDTSANGAKVAFAFKSLAAEMYIDDLRARSMRGLEGRMLAGYAYGCVPTGYHTMPVLTERGDILGHKVVIHEAGAQLIRRIFTEYRDGRSLATIAHRLNHDGIPSPKVGTRNTCFGWGSTTIRWILTNERYIGVWKYKQTSYPKIPGTNKHVKRTRPATEHMVQHRPELAILDPQLWADVQARLADNAQRFGKGRQRGGVTHRRSPQLFTGLLTCRECDGPMLLIGSHPSYYYACGHNHRKGASFCKNQSRVREDVVRPKLLDAIRDRLLSRQGLANLRELAEEKLGSTGTKLATDLRDRKAGLVRTEQKLASLTDFIASGQRSSHIAKTLAELEADADKARREIATLEQAASGPLELPSLDDIEASVRKFDQRLAQDPATAKEQLRRWLAKNTIRIGWEHGAVVAEGGVMPFVVAAESDEKKRPARGKRPNGSALIYDQSTCDAWILRWTIWNRACLSATCVARRIAANTNGSRKQPARGKDRETTWIG